MQLTAIAGLEVGTRGVKRPATSEQELRRPGSGATRHTPLGSKRERITRGLYTSLYAACRDAQHGAGDKIAGVEDPVSWTSTTRCWPPERSNGRRKRRSMRSSSRISGISTIASVVSPGRSASPAGEIKLIVRAWVEKCLVEAKNLPEGTIS